ncbi:recombinase family protein [Serratia plymuthica]|uniref:recombinase family protein n=1 Tax=Serratia plymuthica TaxID=82996 RepID=UPI0007E9C80F|nr:recombinase family protein [Serratia plymuthica]
MEQGRKTKLYSYIRWSSDRQAKGTTLKRQTAKARQYANTNGLEYVEILDAGVSAFRGKNTSPESALGGFIEAVKNGAIPSNSVLYVESLDRLSRRTVRAASRLFDSLLELGLTIVTGMDGKVYTAKDVDENFPDFLMSLFLFSRANEESQTKSKRVKANAAALVKRHNSGLPTTIKSAGSHVFWVDASGHHTEAVKPDPIYWQAARKIIEFYLSGYTTHKICDYLDEHYPPPPVKLNRRSVVGAVRRWSYQLVRRMKTSEALIGNRTLVLDKNTKPPTTTTLEGYYPALCTPDEYGRLIDMAKNNRISQGKHKRRITLLSGMGIARCGHCGGAMTFFVSLGTIRYLCANGKDRVSDCKAWSVRGDIFEHTAIHALVRGYASMMSREKKWVEDLHSEIERKEGELTAVNKQLVQLGETILLVGNTETLINLMIRAEANKRELTTEVKQLRHRQIVADSKEGDIDHLSDFIGLLSNDLLEDVTHPHRANIREAIRAVISSARVTKRQNNSLSIVFDIHDGTRHTFEGGEERNTYIEFVQDLDTDGNPITYPDTEEVREAISKRQELESRLFAAVSASLEAMPPIDPSRFWSKR